MEMRDPLLPTKEEKEKFEVEMNKLKVDPVTSSIVETPTPDYFTTLNPQQKAINLVYGLSKGERHVEHHFDITDVKIVWFCKTLKNWKAMVAILVKGGGFYEVTYNGDKEETYVDYYKKQSNTVIKDEDL